MLPLGESPPPFAVRKRENAFGGERLGRENRGMKRAICVVETEGL